MGVLRTKTPMQLNLLLTPFSLHSALNHISLWQHHFTFELELEHIPTKNIQYTIYKQSSSWLLYIWKKVKIACHNWPQFNMMSLNVLCCPSCKFPAFICMKCHPNDENIDTQSHLLHNEEHNMKALDILLLSHYTYCNTSEIIYLFIDRMVAYNV